MAQARFTSVCTAALWSLLLLSPNVFADEIVAILDLEFLEDTGDTSAVMCFGEDNDDCGAWATYYLFEARVEKVISGELPEERFLVLFGRHALKKQNFYDFVALLKKRDSVDPDEPQYRISGWGERLRMYCFDRRDDDEIETAVELNDTEQLNCYDPDRY